jgi:hypothetical protein
MSGIDGLILLLALDRQSLGHCRLTLFCRFVLRLAGGLTKAARNKNQDQRNRACSA